MELDQQGGIIQSNRQAERRSRDADMITLPIGMPGTNCGNCKFFMLIPSNISLDIQAGHCIHPALDLIVTSRQCCIHWDNPGALRT